MHKPSIKAVYTFLQSATKYFGNNSSKLFLETKSVQA